MDDIINMYWEEVSILAKAMKSNSKAVSNLVEAVINVWESGARVFLMGNGGGASAAEGFAVDLKTHPFVSDDKSAASNVSKLEVHCLNESCGLITGISNDLGYDEIFVEQLKNYNLGGGDLVIGLSGSGNSRNILKAFNYARKCGVWTSCISGRGGGTAACTVDIPIIIPGSSKFPGNTGPNDNNFHIEDFQVSISHIVTGLLREVVQHDDDG